MPRGRMLNKTISVDETLAKLPVDTILLYTFCIPHLDIEGRILADIPILKGVVVPYITHYTYKIIEKCISELAKSKLVVTYGEVHKYLQFYGFKKNQTLNPERESPSRIPSPRAKQLHLGKTPEQLQSNSDKTPLEIKVKLNNKLKLKSKAFREVFNHFIEMRKKTNHSLTDKGKELILENLQKLSKDEKVQIEILEQSIANSWRGVFPLKPEGGKGGKLTTVIKPTPGKYDNV